MTEYLRRAAHWVMWSPLRAAGTLALVLAVILIAVLIRTDTTAAYMRGPAPAIPNSGPMPKVTAAPAAVPIPLFTPPPADPNAIHGQPFTLYEIVASAFISAWAGHISPPAWHASVDFLVTDPLAKSLDFTDPASVPAHKVLSTGDPTELPGGNVNVLVATDAGIMSVTMTQAPSRGWLVSSFERYKG